jgi:hypothetical protein
MVWPKRAFGLFSILITILILIPISPVLSAERNPFAIEVGGGALIPWDGDHREIYGNGVALSLGVSPKLPKGDTWLILETGFVRSQGREFSFDPTFERPEETYWLIPLSVGLRANAFPTSPPAAWKFYVGAALETVFTWWKRDDGETFHNATVGVAVEMRPEVALGGPWSLWLRSRLSLLAGVDYRDSPIPEINYSSNTFQFGMSYRVGE